MSAINIEASRDRLFQEIPDNGSITWNEVLVKAGEFRKQIEGLAFGKPESISRKGNNFVARGKVSAETKRNGIRIIADKDVFFTVEPKGPKIVVKNIRGITVKAAFGLITMNITDLTVEADKSGNFVISTKGLTATINRNGDIVGVGLAR